MNEIIEDQLKIANRLKVLELCLKYPEVVDLLDKQSKRIKELEKKNNKLKEQLQSIQELFDNTIHRNEEAIEWGKNMGAAVGAITFHNEMLKIMKGDVE